MAGRVLLTLHVGEFLITFFYNLGICFGEYFSLNKVVSCNMPIG